MTNWPDETRPGVPLNPERDGWHFLHHPEDLRPVPTPWDAAHQAWCSGGMHSPQGVVDLGYRYLGPCLTPAEVAAQLAAARRAALEEAAREVDCGCAARVDVLARLAADGEKRAAYLCTHGDACCALQAAALRACGKGGPCMNTLHGVPIYADARMLERKPWPRSPARAKRRAAKGHPQFHRWVPRLDFIRMPNGALIAHPAAIDMFRLAIRARAEKEAGDAA